MDYDDMDITDVISSNELYGMDRGDEYRLDSEDDARNAAEIAADVADDGQPWDGLADGEER
ncbi:hypothetical protein [Streptomyces sp. NPDC051569]|uniref:hypothetical protein n=1 Tax=Streptomyces sp. NPDC051569 TaxID=3365661 RepID=UPI0037A831F3